MKLTSLKQLAKLLELSLRDDGIITGAAVDSRLVKQGNVFFALQGAKVDGHNFLREAVNKGASCLVVKKNFTGPNFDLPMLFVEDPLESLQSLSAKLLLQRRSKIIAITGSVGKTTTKDFLTTILKEKFTVSKTPGNANSQTGTPLVIINHTTADEDFLVVEMGMNEPGQIAKLVAAAPPDFAILTHVALAHAENFQSLKEIALEKAEIFKHPKTEFGIINEAIDYFDEVAKVGSCKKYSFTSVEHPHFAPHLRENLAAAITCAGLLGLSAEEIRKAKMKLVLPEKRFEIVKKQGITFVNDSYNASEISLKAALRGLPAGRSKVAVIGEMLELGKFSYECHLNVGKVAFETVDCLFLLGKDCLPIYEYWKEKQKPVEFFLDRSSLEKVLKEKLVPGDVCLLKGGNAHQLWEILEGFE